MVHSTYVGFLCTGATLSLFQLWSTVMYLIILLSIVALSLGKASENREVSRKSPGSPQKVPRKSFFSCYRGLVVNTYGRGELSQLFLPLACNKKRPNFDLSLVLVKKTLYFGNSVIVLLLPPSLSCSSLDEGMKKVC